MNHILRPGPATKRGTAVARMRKHVSGLNFPDWIELEFPFASFPICSEILAIHDAVRRSITSQQVRSEVGPRSRLRENPNFRNRARSQYR